MYKNKCRVCLNAEKLTNIFGSSKICDKIMSLTMVKISPEDNLPDKICKKCLKKLNICVQFIQLFRESDMKLRRIKDDVKNKTELQTAEYSEDSRFSPKSNSEKDLCIEDSIAYEDCIDKKVKDKKICDIKIRERPQCFTCGKVMSSRFRLKTHLRTHTGERPFPCPHCNKSFSLAENLKVHIRTHTGEKPLTCLECGKSFAHTAGLAAHRRKHTGQMPYQCALCPRTFRTIGHLQYHTRRHTGEKNFECETCGRAFITRSDLKKHLLSHTGDKPHICCVCGLRLTRASHLKRHMQYIHKGDKPFACNQYPLKYSQEAVLDKPEKEHETQTEDKT